MRIASFLVPALTLTVAAACSDSTDAAGGSAVDAGAAETSAPGQGGGDAAPPSTDAAAEAASSYVEPANCTLRDDTGGPGQYSDGCVKRAWIMDYVGTYTSSKCELVISVDGAVAATFTMKVLGATLAGTYVTDWDGAPAPGNDSYYRFTTDATFATTKTLNFTSGQKVGAGDERALSLRVENLDTGAPIYKGRYAQVIGGKSEELDCETLTRK